MNLEQIVKETVAKFVAEKQGKDLTGDGKIDSKDYLKARSMAIDKAKDNMDEAVGNFELKKLAREFYSVIKPVKGVQQLQVKTSNDILKTKSGFSQRAFTAGTTNQNQVAREGIANVYIEVHEKENALQVVIGGQENTAMVAQRIDQALTAFVMKNYKDQLQAEYGKSDDGSVYYITVRLKQATNETENLAEDGLNEDYEVAMAQDSLDSIIRAAMMLKTQMGDKEINLPAWIQDHITNSENYIYQAAKGYHESDAQMNDKAGEEEMNEGGSDGDYEHDQEVEAKSEELYNKGLKLFRQGKTKEAEVLRQQALKSGSWLGWGETEFPKYDLDEVFKSKSSFDDYSVGNTAMLNGKKVEIIAMEMDDETGERRAEVKYEDNTIEKEVSINSLDKPQLEEDMGGVRQNLGQEVVQKYGYQLKPIFDKYKESNIEWSQILKQYGSNSPEFKEINDVNKKLSSGFKNAALNGAAIMLKAKGASDTQIRNYFSEYGYFEDWVSDFMDELMDELDALAAKATNKSLDEATVRRWQHYAGIK